jgi:hypothetical protein
LLCWIFLKQAADKIIKYLRPMPSVNPIQGTEIEADATIEQKV